VCLSKGVYSRGTIVISATISSPEMYIMAKTTAKKRAPSKKAATKTPKKRVADAKFDAINKARIEHIDSQIAALEAKKARLQGK